MTVTLNGSGNCSARLTHGGTSAEPRGQARPSPRAVIRAERHQPLQCCPLVGCGPVRGCCCHFAVPVTLVRGSPNQEA